MKNIVTITIMMDWKLMAVAVLWGISILSLLLVIINILCPGVVTLNVSSSLSTKSCLFIGRLALNSDTSTLSLDSNLDHPYSSPRLNYPIENSVGFKKVKALPYSLSFFHVPTMISPWSVINMPFPFLLLSLTWPW